MSLEFNNFEKQDNRNQDDEVQFISEEHEYEKEEYQTHDHEFLGSTKLNEYSRHRPHHSHRFASVSSEEIPLKYGKHKHAFMVSTNFVLDHHHEIGGETGPNIEVGCGEHVHFVKGISTKDLEHFHDFEFATLIEG